MEVVINGDMVSITKLIESKLWVIETNCSSLKLFGLFVEGYSGYDDKQFMREAEILKQT